MITYKNYSKAYTYIYSFLIQKLDLVILAFDYKLLKSFTGF